ncbi:MAG: 2-oxo acid dehydrogenase subunit E2 [Rhizobiaceae bacterium]|nr:2-oxo acid dehydrogenase subunit E2 [Rhizobiaceae bacterium]
MTSALETANSRVVPLSRTARTMVRHMNEAWQAPMFAVTVEVDMSAAVSGRKEGITVTDMILAATVSSLAAHPQLNAHFREDAIVEHEDINIGLAVSSENGLSVPVIHGAQALTIDQIAERRRQIVQKARTGQLRVTDMVGGTFTISNLGMFDVARFTAILNPPQVAILAIGSASKRFVWNNGEPQWRDVAEFSLTCDHRATDGATAAQFLATLKEKLGKHANG